MRWKEERVREKRKRGERLMSSSSYRSRIYHVNLVTNLCGAEERELGNFRREILRKIDLQENAHVFASVSENRVAMNGGVIAPASVHVFFSSNRGRHSVANETTVSSDPEC